MAMLLKYLKNTAQAAITSVNIIKIILSIFTFDFTFRQNTYRQKINKKIWQCY